VRPHLIVHKSRQRPLWTSSCCVVGQPAFAFGQFFIEEAMMICIDIPGRATKNVKNKRELIISASVLLSKAFFKAITVESSTSEFAYVRGEFSLESLSGSVQTNKAHESTKNSSQNSPRQTEQRLTLCRQSCVIVQIYPSNFP
jgi:hypothetical protein